MTSEEDLREEFEFFNIELESADIIDKLKELCAIHAMSAGDIAAAWVAFYNTHKSKVIKMTCDVLDQFDRERLGKKNQKMPQTPRMKNVAPVIYDISNVHEGIDENETEELYNTYSSTPSSTKKPLIPQKRQLTPDNAPAKRFTNSIRSPMMPFSPASFSPAGVTPSRKYSSRSNAGESVTMFGVNDNTEWKGQGHPVYIEPCSSMDKDFKYMFQKLTEKAYVLNDMIEDMAGQLQTHFKIEDLSHVALPVQDQVTVVGRICCDSIGKLNAKSVVLEGSRESSAGRCIPVDLSELKEFSLFPGQIVAMNGINNTGNKFVAKKLYEGVRLPFAKMKVKTEADTGDIHIMVAAGPFTTSDSLTYEPLTDLVKYIIRDKPDVCILMGPFVDVKNEQIEKGNCTATFDDIFCSQIMRINDLAEKTGCKFIILPSYRDVHHDNVYPQPPYKYRGQKISSNLHFVQDPCMLSINNLVVGVTSTDVLMQLGAEEISCSVPGSSDRLGRLTEHLIMQKSFYPLYPPAEDVNIDYECFEVHGCMPVTPHILIIPSDLKQFVKDIKGCCCVNPGRLTKGQGAGTYCRMVINTDKIKDNSSVVPFTAAEVLRV